MPKLLSFLGSPINDLLKTIGGVIDNLHVSETEKIAAQAQLAQVQASFEIKLAEFDTQWATAQRDVIVAEANGHSWLQRNWRPLMMLFFAVLIGIVTWTGGFINGRQLDPAFIMEILSIVKLGLSGYVIGRSVEKAGPAIAKVFVKQ